MQLGILSEKESKNSLISLKKVVKHFRNIVKVIAYNTKYEQFFFGRTSA
jgi:hypothetical protein